MPEVLIKFGLDESLRRYCNHISVSSLLSVQYDSWGEIERLKEGFELSVYRIVQELLNSIIKHSKAITALVQLNHNTILSITVEDNGVGFQSKVQKDGVGLQSILSRVKAMNDTIEIEPGSGVSAYLEFETTNVQRNEQWLLFDL